MERIARSEGGLPQNLRGGVRNWRARQVMGSEGHEGRSGEELSGRPLSKRLSILCTHRHSQPRLGSCCTEHGRPSPPLGQATWWVTQNSAQGSLVLFLACMGACDCSWLCPKKPRPSSHSTCCKLKRAGCQNSAVQHTQTVSPIAITCLVVSPFTWSAHQSILFSKQDICNHVSLVQPGSVS